MKRRLHAQKLVDLADKHCLLQEVDTANHSSEILDLVFTNNCELVSSIDIQDWPSLTVYTSYILAREQPEPVQ